MSPEARLAVVIAATARPADAASIAADLRRLGVRPGMVLLVHASLSALGYVNGGAPAVVAALGEALGAAGTLVLPTHSGQLSDPAHWRDPAVPPAWHASLRATMPAYDPATTPTWRMGALAESFRTHPGVRRSDHPRQSFAARGPAADALVAGHALDCALGERSPLARLYEADARILLLGVGHARNTSLHLAEHRARWPGRRRIDFASPVTVAGRRQWLTVEDLDLDDSDFAALGGDFERFDGAVAIGPVAGATARLMPMRALVDFAAGWIERRRGG